MFGSRKQAWCVHEQSKKAAAGRLKQRLDLDGAGTSYPRMGVTAADALAKLERVESEWRKELRTQFCFCFPKASYALVAGEIIRALRDMDARDRDNLLAWSDVKRVGESEDAGRIPRAFMESAAHCDLFGTLRQLAFLPENESDLRGRLDIQIRTLFGSNVPFELQDMQTTRCQRAVSFVGVVRKAVLRKDAKMLRPTNPSPSSDSLGPSYLGFEELAVLQPSFFHALSEEFKLHPWVKAGQESDGSQAAYDLLYASGIQAEQSLKKRQRQSAGRMSKHDRFFSCCKFVFSAKQMKEQCHRLVQGGKESLSRRKAVAEASAPRASSPPPALWPLDLTRADASRMPKMPRLEELDSEFPPARDAARMLPGTSAGAAKDAAGEHTAHLQQPLEAAEGAALPHSVHGLEQEEQGAEEGRQRPERQTLWLDRASDHPGPHFAFLAAAFLPSQAAPSLTAWRCDGCGAGPFAQGAAPPRWKCGECADFDFCGGCRQKLRDGQLQHNAGHSFNLVGATAFHAGGRGDGERAGRQRGGGEEVSEDGRTKDWGEGDMDGKEGGKVCGAGDGMGGRRRVCAYRACTRPVFVEASGRGHPYCSRRHARAAKEKGEGWPRCQLAGCDSPVYWDANSGRFHDFCNRTHAWQAGALKPHSSAPNGDKHSTRRFWM